MCEAIVGAKNSPSFIQAKDKETVKEDSEVALAVKRAPINRRRLLNVLFGDVVRPHLSTLGASLSKEDLYSGKKQDEKFFTLVVSEYNKEGVITYDGNAFPSIACGKHYLPSNFTAIEWMKAR